MGSGRERRRERAVRMWVMVTRRSRSFRMKRTSSRRTMRLLEGRAMVKERTVKRKRMAMRAKVMMTMKMRIMNNEGPTRQSFDMMLIYD